MDGSVEHLGQLDFRHARENVILLGPPGTGKTHLAVALGIRACLAGQRTLFATATQSPTATPPRAADTLRTPRFQAETRRRGPLRRGRAVCVVRWWCETGQAVQMVAFGEGQLQGTCKGRDYLCRGCCGASLLEAHDVVDGYVREFGEFFAA